VRERERERDRVSGREWVSVREREAFTPERIVTYCSTRVNSRVSLLPRAARIWWAHPIDPFRVKSHQEIAGYHHTLHQSSNIRGRAPQYRVCCRLWMERVSFGCSVFCYAGRPHCAPSLRAYLYMYTTTAQPRPANARSGDLGCSAAPLYPRPSRTPLHVHHPSCLHVQQNFSYKGYPGRTGAVRSIQSRQYFGL
jgi:hypothetical protein